MKHAAAWLAGAGLACSLVTLTGCGSSPEATPVTSAPETQGEPVSGLVFDRRINWVTGDVLVLPIDGIGPNPNVALVRNGREVRKLEGRSEAINIKVAAEDHSAAEWLDAPGTWEASATGTGSRIVVIEPGQGELIGDLVVASRQFSVNWLPLPETLVRAAPNAAEQPWETPVASSVRSDAAFVALCERERLNPLTRWRYRLIFDGLDPAARDQAEPFADRTIEALARQNENRWRVALAWLWAADPAIANSLKKRLAAAVQMPDGRTVPAWPTSHRSLDDLLTGLLDPGIAPTARVRRAERWLAEQVAATVWVIDDGGLLDARRGVVAALGIANLSERATLGWAGIQDSDLAPEPAPLPAFGAISRTVPIPETITGYASVELHAGDWSQIRGVIPGRIRVRPPGLNINSLLSDWTMRDWLAGTPQQPIRQWNTFARLSRLPGGYGWELTVECGIVEGIGDASREQVQVFAGAPTSQLVPVVATPTTQSTNVRTATEPTRWRATLSIPEESVEPDGTLRLAIVRTDSRGRRAAWPRPLMPWQTAPARAALNLNTWDGFRTTPTTSTPTTEPTSGR